MKRLRHPIRSITEPYGKAGLTVAILALVMAMVGGAYAAGKLTSGQKKEVEKIAKKFAGKPGANGTNGTNGSNGAPGEKGAKGDSGAPGENGKSVVVGAATSGECSQGSPKAGATVEVAGEPGTKKAICNGKEGSPWTAGGTLPKGASESGTWAFGETQVEAPHTASEAYTSISFPIRLKEGIAETNTHIFRGAPATGTGDLTAGSNLIKNASGEFGEGLVISGSGIPAGTTITKIESVETSPGPPRVFETRLELSAAVEAGKTATGVSLTTSLPAGCTLNAGLLVAAEGDLCISISIGATITPPKLVPFNLETFEVGAGKTGTVLQATNLPPGTTGFGTWAVTSAE